MMTRWKKKKHVSDPLSLASCLGCYWCVQQARAVSSWLLVFLWSHVDCSVVSGHLWLFIVWLCVYVYGEALLCSCLVQHTQKFLSQWSLIAISFKLSAWLRKAWHCPFSYIVIVFLYISSAVSLFKLLLFWLRHQLWVLVYYDIHFCLSIITGGIWVIVLLKYRKKPRCISFICFNTVLHSKCLVLL